MIKGTIYNTNDLIDAVYEQPGTIIYGLGKIGQLIYEKLSELFYNKAHGKTIVYAVSSQYNIQSTSFADASEILTIKEATEKYPEFPIRVFYT